MTSRGAATRYARALFDIARTENRDLDAVFNELSGFASLAAGNEALARVLTNPAIPAGRKHGVVQELIGRAGAIQPPVAKLLLLMAERDRLGILPDVVKAFENRLMDHKNVVRAELVTATALPDDRVRTLKQGLAAATGRDVQLDTRVDPALIGGAVARIGGTVYDGSVTRQLERMRDTLREAD